MRLAEFKMRLFVFFAYRFLKWAGLRDDPDPPVASFEHNPAEPEPPEHWRRLFSNGPPKHWLDLFRLKSIQLPLKLDSQEVRGANISTNSSEFETGTRSKSRVHSDFIGVRPQHKQNSATYSLVERRAWLNRLRFSPPTPHKESGLNIPKPTPNTQQPSISYVQSETTNKINRTRFVTKSVSFKPSRTVQTVDDDARVSELQNNQNDYVPSDTRTSEARINYQPASPNPRIHSPSYVSTHGSDSETRLTFPSPVSWPNEKDNVPVFDPSPRAPFNLSKPDYVSSPLPCRTSSLQVISHLSTSVNQLDLFSAERLARDPTLEKVEDEDLAGGRAASTFVEWPQALRQNQFNEIAPRRREPAPLKCLDESSNRWPRLPGRPDFEIADEFFARKDELEALQRLEREQKGNRWNV